MGKRLGNIPAQVKMSEEQEQTFTNGINKGRKLENARIVELLQSGEHVFQLQIWTKFLGKNFKWKQRCRCGFYGIFNEHLVSLIKEK